MDSYIREHLVTREEFLAANGELIGQVEGFVKLHETIDHEFVALRSKVDRLEDGISSLSKRFGAV